MYTTKAKGETTMRYIDRTGCQRTSERGKDSKITKMGKLTRTATRIAKQNGLGLLKTHFGTYRVIRASGLGAYNADLKDLVEVDGYSVFPCPLILKTHFCCEMLTLRLNYA